MYADAAVEKDRSSECSLMVCLGLSTLCFVVSVSERVLNRIKYEH